MKIKHFILVLQLVFILPIFCQAGEKTKVLIDTDGAADDFKAISIIMANPDIEIEAITTCDGVLSPDAALIRVRELLCTLHHEGISTAAGKNSVTDICPCRQINEKLSWGSKCSTPFANFGSAEELISNLLSNSDEQLTILCLGSLTNLKNAFVLAPENVSKISKIVWYNGSLQPLRGFNYGCDTLSAQTILNLSLIHISEPTRPY
jgi:pyrimidine-specific ribonucleoside hydrolase